MRFMSAFDIIISKAYLNTVPHYIIQTSPNFPVEFSNILPELNKTVNLSQTDIFQYKFNRMKNFRINIIWFHMFNQQIDKTDVCGFYKWLNISIELCCYKTYLYVAEYCIDTKYSKQFKKLENSVFIVHKSMIIQRTYLFIYYYIIIIYLLYNGMIIQS